MNLLRSISNTSLSIPFYLFLSMLLLLGKMAFSDIFDAFRFPSSHFLLAQCNLIFCNSSSIQLCHQVSVRRCVHVRAIVCVSVNNKVLFVRIYPIPSYELV